jgi:hypothetical protein
MKLHQALDFCCKRIEQFLQGQEGQQCLAVTFSCLDIFSAQQSSLWDCGGVVANL